MCFSIHNVAVAFSFSAIRAGNVKRLYENWVELWFGSFLGL